MMVPKSFYSDSGMDFLRCVTSKEKLLKTVKKKFLKTSSTVTPQPTQPFKSKMETPRDQCIESCQSSEAPLEPNC